ncbi:MAG: hypothetical protein IJK62_09555 [Bacteroidales bacterium]|nr:hypothetical protein [Bacteroidales bacterium]MBR6067526.1 hypothetical protein [Bacteroidales bacterium]
MTTLTLRYDARNKLAKSIIKLIEDSGLFIMLKDDEPNETTRKAMEDAKNDKIYKAKDLNDALRYLNS